MSRHRSARCMLGSKGSQTLQTPLRSWRGAAKPPGGPHTTAQSSGREVTTSRDLVARLERHEQSARLHFYAMVSGQPLPRSAREFSDRPPGFTLRRVAASAAAGEAGAAGLPEI